MASTRVQFDNLRGRKLVGYLEEPDVGEAIGAALLVHCFACAETMDAAVGLSRRLASQGITTLRFDFTGIEQPDNDDSTHVDDIFAAAKWMHGREEPVNLLIGHSLGGCAVLAAAHALKSVRAVATIGAPCDLLAANLVVSGKVEIEQTGSVKLRLAGRSFDAAKELVDDLVPARLTARVRELDRPVLIMHAPDDLVVDFGHADELNAIAEQPKSFVCIDGADHLLNRERDYEFVGDVISAWARRYCS